MQIILNKNCEDRLVIAREIAAKCNEEVIKEILVVGSVSRNLSDKNSDIEIEFLSDILITEEDRFKLIKQIGGTDITPYEQPIGDGSCWIIFRYKEYYIEAGFQSIAKMQDNIKQIVEGYEYSHDSLVLASTMKNAICIRNVGVLDKIKKQLEIYPEGLQKKIIEDTIKGWQINLSIEMRLILAERGDALPLLERMILDVKRILRILYAVNKQWEPDWKWLSYIVNGLKVKPEDLEKRVNSILHLQENFKSLENCFQLIKDTLNLIPDTLELSKEINHILNLLEIDKRKTF